jgi:anaerobic selenocysteine-containing dehydrogenase
MADIVLPVASPFEREALRVGFEISQDAQSFAQLRPPVVPARGESRSDVEIVFALAQRLGLGDRFWNGDIDAAYRHQLAPANLTPEQLRRQPGGVGVPLETRHRKYAQTSGDSARGFATPTKKIEFYSEAMLAAGHAPLPEHVAPLVSHDARPDLASEFPLVLTCAKHTLFCETQHRNLPSLRRHARDPEVELHPQAAAARQIGAGDWVEIVTPHGRVRARAALNDTLAPDVVCGQHGWWEACPSIGAPGYDPFSAGGANFNLVIGNDAIDPISGSVPHRAYVCDIRRLA